MRRNYRKTLAGIAAIAMLLNVAPMPVSEVMHEVSLIVAAEETAAASDVLTYTNHGDHVTITGCDAAATTVEIPVAIEGVLVTEIDGNAFSSCTALTSVTIPSSVTSIGGDSLAMLSEQGTLQDIYYDGTLDGWKTALTVSAGYPPLSAEVHFTSYSYSIGVYNYLEYRKVRSINGNYTHVEIMGCAGEYELPYANVEIPAEIDGYPVTDIESYAFSEQRGILSVTLPSSVTSIGPYAFHNCVQLSRINFPDQLYYIGDYAFNGCTSLSAVALPGFCTTISKGTFAGCTSLTSAVLGGAIQIEPDAFVNCTSLTSVSLCGNLLMVEENAFMNCSALTDVYYDGNEEEWTNNTTIKDGNNALAGAAFHWRSLSESTVNGLNYYLYWDHVEISSADKELVHAEIPEAIDGLPVTGIQASAFSGCEKLESVIIPDSVKTIGDGAFYKCTALTSVTIPDSVTKLYDSVFTGCTSLKDAVIGTGVDSLGVAVFSGCTSLENVTLPEGFTSVHNFSFAHCTSLKSIDLPDTMNYIGYNSFEGCTALESITLPEGLRAIAGAAFQDCTAMTSLHIPASVTTIGTAISAGSSITEITVDENNEKYQDIDGVVFNKAGIYLENYPSGRVGAYTVPEGTLAIEAQAFVNAAGLTSLNTGDTLVTISNDALSGCTNLTELHIGAGLKAIYGNAFTDCDALTTITVAEGNEDFTMTDGMLIDTSSSELLRCPVSKTGTVTVPDGITKISYHAFYNCTGITEVILPEGLKHLYGGAFRGCTGLTGITLPSTLKTIQSGAFSDCTGLTSIVIPDGANFSGGSFAFSGCTNLKEITLPESVRGIPQGVFADCTALTTVYYQGMEDQWAEVFIHEDQNDALRKAQIIFTVIPTLGDINGDTAIDATDAADILLAAATAGATGESGLYTSQETCADLNGDGTMDAVDAAWLLHYTAYLGSGGTDSIEVYLQNHLTAAE